MNEGRYFDDPVEWHVTEGQGNGFKTTAEQIEDANNQAFERARANRQRSAQDGH